MGIWFFIISRYRKYSCIVCWPIAVLTAYGYESGDLDRYVPVSDAYISAPVRSGDDLKVGAVLKYEYYWAKIIEICYLDELGFT